ncbi:MAG TPA: gas vesicle protein GvpG [Longimicrobiaceae bacterium]|nr:gas vesicle protein GvpG [Longimicrobiaceae bacterium]
MGLLKHLLFWPVTGPEFLIKYSIETVEDVVREELTDDQVIKEDLMALQMQLELGEIDDDEYVEREAEMMARLRDVRHWREEFGMGLSGGPVQVKRDEDPNVAEAAVGEPDAEEKVDASDKPKGGVASSEGASVELNLDWD